METITLLSNINWGDTQNLTSSFDIFRFEMYAFFLCEGNTDAHFDNYIFENKIQDLMKKYNYQEIDDILDDIFDFSDDVIQNYQIKENGVQITINKSDYDDYKSGKITPFREME